MAKVCLTHLGREIKDLKLKPLEATNQEDSHCHGFSISPL